MSGTGLTLTSGGREACYPDWSSANRIAFTAGFGRKISTMDPDGSNVTSLVRLLPFHSNIHIPPVPSWSPDGASLAFAAQNGHPLSDVWVIGSNGAGLTRLTRTPDRWESSAIFSPDGTAVAFSRTNGRDFASTDDLWTIGSTGLDLVRLTHTPKTDEIASSWQAT